MIATPYSIYNFQINAQCKWWLFYLLFFLLFLSLSLFTHYRVFVRNVSNVIIKSRNSESISVNSAYTLIHSLTRMHGHQHMQHRRFNGNATLGRLHWPITPADTLFGLIFGTKLSILKIFAVFFLHLIQNSFSFISIFVQVFPFFFSYFIQSQVSLFKFLNNKHEY